MASDPRDTPAMRQHARFKARHPDCLLLFRIGDFYELFDDDAVTASRALGLTLTQRTAGIPMAGVPHHQLEVYLRRLIEQGFRVAVCEQTQDAAEAKGIVERAVTRVLTPGTLVDEALLAEDAASTLAAVCFPPWPDGVERAAIAVVELSTGSFTLLPSTTAGVEAELARRHVCEVLYPETADRKPPPRLATALAATNCPATPLPQWHFRAAEALEALRLQYGVATLAGFGFSDDDPLLIAAGAAVRYLRSTQAPDDSPAARAPRQLAHLRPPRREAPGEHLLIDAVSLRALEVDGTLRPPANAAGRADGSLLGVFSTAAGRPLCRTPMGKRLLRDWLCRPLARLGPIMERQRAVATLHADRRTAEALAAALAGVQDIPRMAARVALARSTPRDLVALARSVERCPALGALVGGAPAFAAHAASLSELQSHLEPVAKRILAACVDAPPAHLREGGLVRDGVDAALDEARHLKTGAAQWLADYQARLVAEHAIPTLKVGFNKIFGYYIELSKAQAAKAPASFSRRQTLTGAERYITPELKEFEDKVTHAHARAIDREAAIFGGLCQAVAEQLAAMDRFAAVAAELDVLLAFADKAHAAGWTRPEMSEAPVLRVDAGRHPVLDSLLGADFVPNDVVLGLAGAEASGPSLALLTGPNMAGKSTFIRQTALLVLLAHAGAFVPAASATIGLTDRIFTRVGADDALHAGQSTFMVEMTETAAILHHATPQSLVILDEIGRGTSTLDGLSLAWAIAEHLAAPPATASATDARGPRTLFATHYHELTALEESLPGRVRNLHVAVREWGDQIVFLHQILPGRADQSYGIHVAKLAGIPAPVVARARAVLDSLSVHHHAPATPDPAAPGAPAAAPPPGGQLALFTEYLPHPALQRLRELKLDALSPLQAFDTLRRLHESASGRA